MEEPVYRSPIVPKYSSSPPGGRRGRAIVDLMILIAVIAVFSSMAMIVLSRYSAIARKAVLRANVGSLYLEMASMAYHFDTARLFSTAEGTSGGEPGEYDTFSQYMKTMLDRRSAEADAKSYRNPVSGSVRVVCDTAFPLYGEDARPAVLFTDNASARYGALAEGDSHPDLRGCLVVVLANGRDEAEVYFVDESGVKSGVCYRLQGFGS